MTITRDQLYALKNAFEGSYQEYKTIEWAKNKIEKLNNPTFNIGNMEYSIEFFYKITAVIMILTGILGWIFNIKVLLIITMILLIACGLGLPLCFILDWKTTKLYNKISTCQEIIQSYSFVIKSLGCKYPQELSYKTAFMYFYNKVIANNFDDIQVNLYINDTNNYIKSLANESFKTKEELYKEIYFYSEMLHREININL